MRSNLIALACLLAGGVALADSTTEISKTDEATLIAFATYEYASSGWSPADHPSNGIEDGGVKVLDTDTTLQKQIIDEIVNRPADDKNGMPYWLKHYCRIDQMPKIRVDLAVVKYWRFGDPYGNRSQVQPIEFMHPALPNCPTLVDVYEPNAEQVQHMKIWKKIKSIHYVLSGPVGGKPFFKVISDARTSLQLQFDDKTGELTIAYNRNVVNMFEQGNAWYAAHF